MSTPLKGGRHHIIRNIIRQRKKVRLITLQNIETINFTDIFSVENLVYTHSSVQQIVHSKDKVPTIILYTDEQILDLEQFCVKQGNLLGFDKTFNLSKEIHVTACAFKQKSVVRNSTGDHPILTGPLYTAIFHFLLPLSLRHQIVAPLS